MIPLLVQYWTADVPYKSVIADLASRDGPPGADNYPFNGMRSHLEQKCRNQNNAIWMDSLCNTTEDFNIRNPNFCNKYHNGRPYRCIDEVSESVLQIFMEQKLWGATHYTTSGVVQYQYNTQEQYALSSGEDEHMEPESYFKSEVISYSPEDLNTWKRKLPYLVKRLVDRSEYFGVNIMSGIVARLRCSADGDIVSLGNLAKHGILSYPNNFPLPRSLIPKFFVDWVTGQEQDEYYDDLCDLCNICDKLNINLANENPYLYTKEFVNHLASDYIVENVRLYRSIAREISPSDLSPDLLRVISQMSLDDVVKLPQIIYAQHHQRAIVTPVDAIRHTIDLFRYQSDAYPDMGRRSTYLSREQLLQLVFVYFQLTNRVVDISGCSFVDEFLMSRGTEFFLLDVSELIEDPFSGTSVIIHCSGIVILVRLDCILSTFKYLPFPDFYHSLQMSVRSLRASNRIIPIKWYNGL